MKSTISCFLLAWRVCFCVFGSDFLLLSDQVEYVCFHEQALLPLCDDYVI